MSERATAYRLEELTVEELRWLRNVARKIGARYDDPEARTVYVKADKALRAREEDGTL